MRRDPGADADATLARQQAQRAAAYAYAVALISQMNKTATEYRSQLSSDLSSLQSAITARTSQIHENVSISLDASESHIVLLADGASLSLQRSDESLTLQVSSPKVETKDAAHAQRLNGLKSRVQSARPNKSYQKLALESASASIEASDEASGDGDKFDATLLADMAEVLIDIATAFPPGIGWARDVYEACTGSNLVTGEKLSDWELGVAFVGAASGGMASKVISSERVLQRLAKITQRLLSKRPLQSRMLADEVDKAHRIARQVIEAWDRRPDRTYEIGKYAYKTDALGRIKSVAGELGLEKVASDSYQQRKVRDAIGQLGDDAGHLISGRFGGTASPINLIPMESGLNRGVFRGLEDKWSDALSRQSKVKVTISPNYVGNSPRPSTIGVQYDIDGAQVDMTLFNRLPNTR